MTARAKLEIWNRANSSKLGECWAVDGNGNQRNFDTIDATGEKLGEAGSGGVVLQADHPIVSVAVPGNVCRLIAEETSGSTVVFAWTIAERDRTTVARKQVDRTIVLDGDGLLERWRGVTVDPWMPGRPISIDRIWNWAAPRGFDDSSWSTTTYFQTRVVEPIFPEAYPVAPLYAGQIWSRPSSIEQPAGSVLFRRTVPDLDAGTYAFFASADDAVNLWSSGVLLNRHSIQYPDKSGWQKTQREAVPVDAGDHVFAAEAFNLAVGGAFFMGTIMEALPEGVVGDAVASTGDDLWRWHEVSGERPGFTAPQIMQMLLAEAQARGSLTGWSIVTHGTFANIEEFSCRVGTSYREVIDMLAVADADFAVATEGLVLHMWPKDGRGGTPAITIGADQVDELSIVDGDDVVTAVQCVWSDGVEWVEYAPHPVFGRVEASLALGSVTTVEAARRIGAAYLAAHGTPSQSIVGALENIDGKVAGVDYKVGDTFPLLSTSVRCVGITHTVDRAGMLVPAAEFDTVAGVRRRERLRAVDRETAMFDSPATASLLASTPQVISGFPKTGVTSWSWADDVDMLEDLDDPDRLWQPWEPDTTQRLWKIAVQIDPDDLPDAWGDTKIGLFKNGSLINVLYNATLTTSVYKVEHQIWAYETVTKGDRIQIAVLDRGGHVNGTVSLHYADPI